MKKVALKNTLAFALFLAGMTALQAMAHIGYGGRDFGSFTGAFVGMVAFDTSGQGKEARFTSFSYDPT